MTISSWILLYHAITEQFCNVSTYEDKLLIKFENILAKGYIAHYKHLHLLLFFFFKSRLLQMHLYERKVWQKFICNDNSEVMYFLYEA